MACVRGGSAIIVVPVRACRIGCRPVCFRTRLIVGGVRQLVCPPSSQRRIVEDRRRGRPVGTTVEAVVRWLVRLLAIDEQRLDGDWLDCLLKEVNRRLVGHGCGLLERVDSRDVGWCHRLHRRLEG